MHTVKTQSLLIGAALYGLGAVTSLFAMSYGDSAHRVEQHRAELSGAEHMEVIISTAEYKTGETLPRHSHHGLEATYIVQGTDIQMPGKEPVSIATGKSLLNLRDVMHGGFSVVGDIPLKLLTVHVVDKGKPLYVYAD